MPATPSTPFNQRVYWRVLLLRTLFMDNVFDSHTILNYNHQTNSYSDDGVLLASPAYRYISYRPRTIGVTVVFRH